MPKLSFVPGPRITRRLIFDYFKKVNMTVDEWYEMFNLNDLKLNIEGKITRKKYFTQWMRIWKIPYRKALLFENLDDLHKATLVAGFPKEQAKSLRDHEEKHANRLKELGYNPFFGLFIDGSSPALKETGIEIKFMAFTFKTDGREVALKKYLSVEQEIEEDIYTADIEDKQDHDKKKIETLKKLKERKQRGVLPEWGF